MDEESQFVVVDKVGAPKPVVASDIKHGEKISDPNDVIILECVEPDGQCDGDHEPWEDDIDIELPNSTPEVPDVVDLTHIQQYILEFGTITNPPANEEGAHTQAYYMNTFFPKNEQKIQFMECK